LIFSILLHNLKKRLLRCSAN